MSALIRRVALVAVFSVLLIYISMVRVPVAEAGLFDEIGDSLSTKNIGDPSMVTAGRDLYVVRGDRLYKFELGSLARQGVLKLEDAAELGLPVMVANDGSLFVLKDKRLYEVDPGSLTIKTQVETD